MSKKIEYQSGEKIGECIYLYDIDPYVSETGNRLRRAQFKCALCGTEFETNIGTVKYGDTGSCGCLLSESTAKRLTTHGLSGSSIYDCWCVIKGRCYNPRDSHYKDYGGRGIKMCDEWRNSFLAFYKYVSKLPHYGDPKYSIDREENDGNYEPGNVRWATKHQQCTNQRIRKDNKTGYVGVTLRNGRFIAGIRVNGKQKYLGTFNTAKEAVTARNNYIIEHNLTEYKIQKL